MTHRTLRQSASLAALGLSLLEPAAALAQSRVVTTPNITNTATNSVTVGGQTFVNKGLQGAGRLSANTLDFRGETLGSFSGMAINLSTWGRNADGSYASSIYTLPDRGPFDGGIDYRDRVHTETITFNPLASGSAALPQATTSQSQLVITPTGGFTLKDANGVEFTGRDPGASITTRGGIVYPLATDGTAAGHIALDPEAIAFLPNGNFYVSDEYAAGIYLFNPAGTQIGAIQTVNALLPRNAAGVIDMNSVNPGVTGRRNNQGLEAMALTPDNKKLVTILQSATVQDTNGANQQTRNTTRILIYDISSNGTPANPVAHYVLQLPVFNNNGAGAADRTAAQSEVLALNDTQFLVLSRDGIGRGIAANGSASATPVFKSILLVDTAGATNLAGTPYETTNTPLATNGTLAAGIVPVQQVELINMLNPTELARVGMNLTRLPLSNPKTLSEKIEAMALAPVLEESNPQDFFLFVGNDNDFQATNGVFNGASATLGALDGTGNNDSVMLVYRLTLPTYVDPQALAALNLTAPDVLYGTRMIVNALGRGTTGPAMRWLNAGRGAPVEGGRRAQLWMDLDWSQIGAGASPLTGLDVDTVSTTIGLDIPAGEALRFGVTGGYRTIDGRLAHGAGVAATAWTVGAYAAIDSGSGIYAQAAAGWLGDVDFDRIGRVSVYGQRATGQTKGDGWTLSGEAGWRIPAGVAQLIPFAAVGYVDMKVDGYTETGASVSNLTYADRKFRQITASFGGEVAMQVGPLRPAIRAGYSVERERGDRTTTVSLASSTAAMATVALPLADTERDSAFAELRIAMGSGPISGFASARGRWGHGDDDARVSMGVGYAF